MSLSAIIVAAGNSTRAGFDKLFALVAGQPVIQYSICAFEQTQCVDQIVIVCREATAGAISELVASVSIRKIRAIVPGGERRQDSVAAGLKAISELSEFIAVHDAARPLITSGEIERVFAAARKHDGAVLAAPVTDTLKLASAEGMICGSIDRENVVAMQTPQIFARQLLIHAYKHVTRESRHITDEVTAVQMIGGTVAIVPAQEPNKKVTFATDLPVAEFILRQRASFRAKV